MSDTPSSAPATHPSLDEVRATFAHDRFATEACGCEVVESAPGRATCALDVTPRHRNERGGVMGGAIFTLCDFALAVASNAGRAPAVTVDASIQYLAGCRGTRLTATATSEREGRTLGFYTVDATDELGTHVARMTATCYRVSHGATDGGVRHT